MIDNIAVVTYTNSVCEDIWPIYFGQLDKYASNIDSFVFSDIESEKISDRNRIVTYNNDDELKEAYQDFHQEIFKITYGMKHRADNKNKTELLVANYDLYPPSPLELLSV